MKTTIAVIGAEENLESIEAKLSVAGEIIKRGWWHFRQRLFMVLVEMHSTQNRRERFMRQRGDQAIIH